MAGNESIAAEVIAASVGGAFSASALYPLEVLKTKMQAETKGNSTSSSSAPPPKASEQPKGCNCPCVGCTGCSLRHANRTDAEVDLPNEQDSAFERFESATADASSSDDDKKATAEEEEEEADAAPVGMVTYARRMYDEGGIPAFYAGIETSAIQSATEKALYFFAYTFLKNLYHGATGSERIGTGANLALGCMAEWAHLPITLPIDCLTTKIQTDTTGAGAFALLSAMLSEKGIAGMYKGIQAYTILCLKPAIQYTVYEQVKKIVLVARRAKTPPGARVDESLGAAEAFLLGMVARTVATLLTFPYLRAKVMLQSVYGDVEPDQRPTIPGMLGEMFMRGGVSEMFQGIGPELTRGVFSAALMLMVKEKIAVVVRALVDGQTKELAAAERR